MEVNFFELLLLLLLLFLKGVGKCFQRETVEGEKELNCNICDKGVENNF